MMNRLRLVREVDTIRQAVPANTFRSESMAEAQLRASVLKKTLAQIAETKQQNGGAAAHPPSATAAAPSPQHYAHHHPQQQQQQHPALNGNGAYHHPAHAPSQQRVVRRLGSQQSQRASASAATQHTVPPAQLTPLTPVADPAPALPFAYRRACKDIQITDAETGELLQLDSGSWVLTAAAPSESTHMLQVYTISADTGLVLTYDIPVPHGRLPALFDRHTLNVIETMSEEPAAAPPAAASTTASAAAAAKPLVLPAGY